MTTKQIDTTATMTALTELISSVTSLMEKVKAAADADYATFVLTQSDASRETVKKAREALDLLPKFANAGTRKKKANGADVGADAGA